MSSVLEVSATLIWNVLSLVQSTASSLGEPLMTSLKIKKMMTIELVEKKNTELFKRCQNLPTLHGHNNLSWSIQVYYLWTEIISLNILEQQYVARAN